MQQARIMICCPRQESEIQNLPGQHIFFSTACFFLSETAADPGRQLSVQTQNSSRL
jgi:hypothetical protein